MIKNIFFISTFLLIQYSFCKAQSDITEIIYPIVSDSYVFTDIKFIDKDLGYLLLNSRLFKTTDLGENFSEINITSTEDHFSGIITRKNFLVLLTEYGCCMSYTMSTNSGSSWVQNDLSGKYYLQFFDDGIIYAMSYSQGTPSLYYSNDAGLNWEIKHKFDYNVINLGEDFSQENKIYFLNNKFGFYFGRYNVVEDKWRYKSSDKSKIFIYKTTDSGINWTQINAPIMNDINNIYFEDTTNGFFYCTQNDAEGYVLYECLMRTTDGGKKWFVDNNLKEFENYIYIPDKYNFQFYHGTILRENVNNIFVDLLQIKDNISYIEFVKPDIYFIQIEDKIYKTSNLNNTIKKSNISRSSQFKEDKSNSKQKADNFIKEKKYSDALTIYAGLILAGSLDFELFLGAGYCADKLENFDDAVYYFGKAIEIDPSDYIANNKLGLAYENINNYEMAKKYYEVAASITIDLINESPNTQLSRSIKKLFDESESDIALSMYFPKNWNLTDLRQINKDENQFKGVVLTDTTAELPNTMTMYILLENDQEDYNSQDHRTEFNMLDPSLIAFSKKPITVEGFTESKYYVFKESGTEKLSIRAAVRKQFYNQYKNEIDAVVKSIRIKTDSNIKADDLEKDIAENNLRRIIKKLYKSTNDDFNNINTYFPINKPGSFWVYYCKNNSAPIQKEIVTENNDNNYFAHTIRQYYRSMPYYQGGNYLMQEEKSYQLYGPELICEYKNPQIGNFKETILLFPLETGTTWKNVLGLELSVIKFNETVSTVAGTFTDCLMIGNDILTYYYAPGIGLVLSQGYDKYGIWCNFDELIDYSIK